MAIHHYLPRSFPSLLLLIFLQSDIANTHSPPSAKGQYVEVFKNLIGHRKGENVTNIHLVKKYLNAFGYLPSDGHNNVGESSLGEDDCFDDRLESAIKTFQLNYNLNVTGTLDARTIRLMMMPRCGMPDIVHGRTSMGSGKNRHLLGSSGFHAVSHYSFFPTVTRWPSSKYRLSYAYHVSVPSWFRPSVARAFFRWTAISPFTFYETSSYNFADITIGVFSGDHGDTSPFDGPGNTVAHAYQPTIGWFHFDKDETWDIYLRAGTMDVESVAVHEIGHLLGLMHSSYADAIMYPYIPSGTKKVIFHLDDILGIRDLYNL